MSQICYLHKCIICDIVIERHKSSLCEEVIECHKYLVTAVSQC